MKTFDIIKEMLITNHSVLNEQWWKELGTEAGTKAAVDAAKLELKNLVSSLVHDGKKLTAAGIKNSKVYLEQLERLSQASAKKAGYGSWAKFVAKDPKGAADAIREVTNGMNEEILGAAKSMNKPIEGTLTIVKDDAKAATTKIGKTASPEIDAFFKNVKENSRLSVNLQKVRGEAAKLKPQTLKQYESSMEKLAKLRNKGTGPQVGGKVTTGSGTVSGVKNGKGFLFTREQLASYPGEILHYVISAKGLKTLLGIGVTAALIYWIYQSLNPNSLIVVTDENGKDIQDGNNEWAPCIKELIDSKEGTLKTLEGSGIRVVQVITPEYPEGLNFTSNGRVADVATKKMGSWKCKGAMPVIAESQKISLMGLLNEQSSEIDLGTMESYVDTAVDDLDGFVDTDNLNSLLSILNSLKGKTFQGKDAIKEFLSLYKEDEGGDDFVADVNSVGVKTLGTKAIIAKRQILSLAQGGGSESSTTTTPDAKTGLSKIDITWDGEKKTDDGGGGDTPVVKKKSVNYHDCSNNDFPYEFGCIAPKISEIQACLGVTPQKGYFGPKTLAALKAKDFIDSSNTITKETYDKVAAICGGQENKQDGETKKRNLDTEPIKTISPKEIPSVKIGGDLTKLPTIQPTDAMNGQKIYEALSSNYGDGTNPEYPYIFQEGGRIKYKGEGLPQETLNALNTYISSMGYYYMKGKPKEDYGYKYVWVKQ
jgi:hypothetical protein